MSRLLAAARRAAAGGRFVTSWTILASLILSLTLMSPTSDGPSGALLIAGLATWATMVAGLAAVAVAERVLRTPAVRAGIVLGAVAVIAAARPFVQDAWLRAVAVAPPPAWQLPYRIATNVVAWLVVVTAIAVIVDAVRSLRDANALLRSAAAALAASGGDARAYTAQARAAVRAAADGVQSGLDDLAAPTAGAGFDARRFAAGGIRPASHALAELAEAPAITGSRPGVVGDAMRAGRRAAPLSLRVPPRGLVTIIYLACLLPYAAHSASAVELLVGVVAVVCGGAAADALCRRRGARHRVGVFLVAALGCGAGLSLIGSGFGAPASRAVVPLVVYPLIALAASACAGTIHALHVEQHRLSGAIEAAQRASRTGTRPARDALRTAAELLHRDGQGRCTVFAIEHPHPTAPQVDALAGELRALLVRVRGVFDTPARTDAASLDGLLETWGRVVGLHAEIDDAARAVLDTGLPVTQDAYDVAAEGILNAVKHSGERRVDVRLEVVATGAGPALRVRVSSFAPLAPGVRLRPASHVRSLGASLRSTLDGAVLEAVFPLDAPVRAGAVVSAEHPG